MQAAIQAKLQALHFQARARARLEVRRRQQVAEPEPADVVERIMRRFWVPELGGAYSVRAVPGSGTEGGA